MVERNQPPIDPLYSLTNCRQCLPAMLSDFGLKSSFHFLTLCSPFPSRTSTRRPCWMENSNTHEFSLHSVHPIRNDPQTRQVTPTSDDPTPPPYFNGFPLARVLAMFSSPRFAQSAQSWGDKVDQFQSPNAQFIRYFSAVCQQKRQEFFRNSYFAPDLHIVCLRLFCSLRAFSGFFSFKFTLANTPAPARAKGSQRLREETWLSIETWTNGSAWQW